MCKGADTNPLVAYPRDVRLFDDVVYRTGTPTRQWMMEAGTFPVELYRDLLDLHRRTGKYAFLRRGAISAAGAFCSTADEAANEGDNARTALNSLYE